MNKNYTLLYLLENFGFESDDLIDCQIEFNEFDDVIELLNQFDAEPSDNVIENILQFSKSIR